MPWAPPLISDNFSVHASHEGSGYRTAILKLEPVPILAAEHAYCEGTQP